MSRSRGRGGKRQKQGGKPRQNRPQGGRGKGRDRGVGFWGDAGQLPAVRRDVRVSADAAAVPRSLGPPPLTGHETIAEHYLAAVYERSVMLAGALATAGDLAAREDAERS